jgi:hypothetical protein
MSRLKIKPAELKSLMLANAQEINRLQQRIHETVKHRSSSQQGMADWKAACAESHSRFDGLAFPGGISTAFERIDQDDLAAISDALTFLEMRPYFFHSGYFHSKFMRKLKHKALPPAFAERRDDYFKRYAEWRAAREAKRSRRPSATTE